MKPHVLTVNDRLKAIQQLVTLIDGAFAAIKSRHFENASELAQVVGDRLMIELGNHLYHLGKLPPAVLALPAEESVNQ